MVARQVNPPCWFILSANAHVLYDCLVFVISWSERVFGCQELKYAKAKAWFERDRGIAAFSCPFWPRFFNRWPSWLLELSLDCSKLLRRRSDFAEMPAPRSKVSLNNLARLTTVRCCCLHKPGSFELKSIDLILKICQFKETFIVFSNSETFCVS